MSINRDSRIVDSYALFIDKFDIAKENLYLFGIEETILPDLPLIDNQWEAQKIDCSTIKLSISEEKE